MAQTQPVKAWPRDAGGWRTGWPSQPNRTGHSPHAPLAGSWSRIGTYRQPRSSQPRGQDEWVGGRAYGPGSLHFVNGNQYDGLLQAGRPHGNGRMAFTSGDSYEGQFAEGEFNGVGTYRWKSGDTYTGNWQSGRKEGQGSIAWSNGDRWDGLFKDDKQTEQGELKRH